MTSKNTPSDNGGDRPVIGTVAVELAVSLCILALAVLLGWDSYRMGAGWADNAPQAGYFPFYLSVIMGAAALYGLVSALLASARARNDPLAGEPFVTREQLARVGQVFIATLAFCAATQFIGIYAASFLLTAGFMWRVGGISVRASVVTSLIFAAAMFATFEVAFHVVMPKGPLEALLGY